MTTPRTVCSIIPPYLLEHLARSGDDDLAAVAQRTRAHDEAFRADREPQAERLQIEQKSRTTAKSKAKKAAADDGSSPLRTIGDAENTEKLPGRTVRAEGEKATGDAAVDEAYDALGATWQLYDQAFGRDSIDDSGLALLGTVHYGTDYDNAFWDGEQMVFGDGDGTIFNRFTASVDVIGHELTHGVTQYTAALVYQDQSGALNESLSDVFGVMVAQHAAGQSVEEADWLVGADLLAAGVKGRALRDMENPGTAYDDPRLGKDPQPAHMDDYDETTDDNGGVHINSGIPNRAFVIAAKAFGGNSWEGAGLVWYDVLIGDRIQARCDFATFAQLTVDAATQRFGEEGAQKVSAAWQAVGVTPSATKKAKARKATKKSEKEKPSDSSTTQTEAAAADPATPVQVTRSGGFAGLVRRRETTLGELPDDDREHWRHLLGRPGLREFAAERVRPDAFQYRVCCDPVDLDVTMAEHALPKTVRSLLDRTLSEGEER